MMVEEMEKKDRRTKDVGRPGPRVPVRNLLKSGRDEGRMKIPWSYGMTWRPTKRKPTCKISRHNPKKKYKKPIGKK